MNQDIKGKEREKPNKIKMKVNMILAAQIMQGDHMSKDFCERKKLPNKYSYSWGIKRLCRVKTKS